MPKKLHRSNSGLRGSLASSRTRRSKLSHDSSRFINNAGSSMNDAPFCFAAAMRPVFLIIAYFPLFPHRLRPVIYVKFPMS